MGVSLGGNVVLKWLGERGSGSPLQRAVAISVPFRLDAAAARLEGGLSRLYQRHLLDSLANQLGGALELRQMRDKLADVAEQRRVRQQELLDRGIDLLRVCPACGRCSDGSLPSSLSSGRLPASGWSKSSPAEATWRFRRAADARRRAR